MNTLDGRALVFDGEKQNKYLNNLNMIDIHGKNLFTPQIKAFHNGDEGGFMQYYFKRIDGTEEEPKISYMKGYHKWNWIIGAGEYLNDIDKEIYELENELKKRLKTKIIYIVLLLLLLCVILIFISISITSFIEKEFKIFMDYFKFSKSGDHINLQKFRIRDLRTIASHANEMRSKIDKTNKLLSENEAKY